MEKGTDVSLMKRAYKTVNKGEFDDNFVLEGEIDQKLRYGENPNQAAAIYKTKELVDFKILKDGKNGLSATNIMDITRALDILKFFKSPSVAVMKHLVPAGFATQYKNNSLTEIYVNARDSDMRSAFGSVVVTNSLVDFNMANEILKTYVECVAAPNFEEGVIDKFNKKKSMRIIEYSKLDNLPKFIGDKVSLEIRTLPTERLLVQEQYLSSIRSVDDLILNPRVSEDYVKRKPTNDELKDLLTAWYVNIGVRSNGIVIVKNGVASIGSGQQERVGAVEQAIVKVYQKAMDREGITYDPLKGRLGSEKLKINPLYGAVLSSDAFFPFRDSIDLCARVGISAIIQPGGSVRDNEVIKAINENGMSMVYTLERSFSHF